MTNLQAYFDDIESVRFSAYMNAASGLSVLRRGFADDETLASLIQEMQTSPHTQSAIFDRINTLLSKNPDLNLLHPHDVVIAAYLYVLNQASSDYTQQAIDQIVDTPNLFWAYRLADHIQNPPEQPTPENTVTQHSD